MDHDKVIRENLVQIKDTPATGVYFLFEGDKVVYVGQSRSNLFLRIRAHLTDKDKRFDSFSYIECAKEELDSIESFYIVMYAPRHNRTYIKDLALHFSERNVIPANPLKNFFERLKRRDPSFSDDNNYFYEKARQIWDRWLEKNRLNSIPEPLTRRDRDILLNDIIKKP